MARYQQRAHVVDAWQFGTDELPEEINKHHMIERGRGRFEIRTAAGDLLKPKKGDYIVRGYLGHLYVYRKDIFEQNFEKL